MTFIDSRSVENMPYCFSRSFDEVLLATPVTFGILHVFMWLQLNCLSYWGRVTHIRVAHLTIIASDNGLSPSRRRATIWTNAGILLIRPLGTNFSEILFEIHTFSFKKMHLKMSSAKRRSFCLGLDVLWSPYYTSNSDDTSGSTFHCWSSKQVSSPEWICVKFYNLWFYFHSLFHSNSYQYR